MVAALRFLTDAVFEALHRHDRLKGDLGLPLDEILGLIPSGQFSEDSKATRLPCRPEDDEFESRTKAVLRRYVVERCIYGVDLDPLASDLCRLALWVETMDRTLPFSFLDHKIKWGNSLVGAWFDQFQHYPVMAWKNREGGDKNHTNGAHFEKEALTKAIKTFVRQRLQPDLVDAIEGQLSLGEENIETPARIHDEAFAVLSRLHEMPIQDAAERSRTYRNEILGSGAFRSLKDAMDLWCACWFWPADDLEHAPLPRTLAAPTEETRIVAGRVAARKRFFHWELEFPDVFHATSSGFDGVLGNPPWDIAKPVSKEFFSNIDPLYRSYGKQEALHYQKALFENEVIERDWLDYNADFRAQSNYMKYSAYAFGDPNGADNNQDGFSIARGNANAGFHTRWRDARAATRGYADTRHPFRHQGSADINLYKLFLEQAHSLLRERGRLGFIVPSGLYSDYGTGALRELFLDRCSWEWLFGFENRDKVFEIDSRFKFNPVIIERGGRTKAIRTAFMRRKLEDWERAEALATPYTREQVERFSPRSKAILEIQSTRDLEILEKIYSNSVLLGDDGPDGWGIKYATEFHMTNDSKLFPPRPKWEAEGYRPDEYSRWLKGDWRPIAELWAELGIDTSRPKPVEIELEDWLFDTSTGPEEHAANAPRAHDQVLKPGDVQRTTSRLRCAQPPYDSLPIPRANIPSGIILSREADAWVREERVGGTALPFMQGVMLHQFDFSQKGWISGTGLQAKWEPISWDRKIINPQFLMGLDEAPPSNLRTLHRRVARNTDSRMMIASLDIGFPAGDKAPVLMTRTSVADHILVAVLNSFVFDAVLRNRCGSTNIDLTSLEAMPLPKCASGIISVIAQYVLNLNGASWLFAPTSLDVLSRFRLPSKRHGFGPYSWSITDSARLSRRSALNAVSTVLYALVSEELRHILDGCDLPIQIMGDAARRPALNAKGFWRVDKDRDPELRHTVLTLVAFHDLEAKVRECGGDREEGIEAFLNQNNGEGWMLPETLRLADYALGHDDRAKESQPVASRLGPRFYDWQLTQTVEESWRECHLHARNLLGEAGYQQLLSEIGSGEKARELKVAEPAADYQLRSPDPGQPKLF